MRTGISIRGVEADRQRLDALVADRDTPQKHVWRAQISLLSAAGVGTNAVMATTGKSTTTVWRWQARFMAQGLDGLLRDKTRPPGGAPASGDRAAAIVAMTLEPPPHEATHRTARAMAGTVGLSVSTVRKTWKTHGLAPHRRRSFKLSNDPAFAEKPHDVVGLSAAPPAHAIVLSVDEKSRIQALDRPQPGLPLKKRRGATTTISATARPRCSRR
jgi:transposase